MTTLPPSGEQFEIVHGEQRATIVEVGGGVREYTVGARPVLDPYPLHAMCDGAHGAPLIPWPNRLADGRYRFDGEDHQLALTEPARRNAIHGLLRWRPWRALAREPSRVVVGARLYPLSGYPFALDVQVEYALAEDGLSVCTTAVNVGDRACPYGAGQHPYLSPGEGSIDECTLALPARTRILIDDERQLPAGREAVAGGEYDFAGARALGRQPIDCPFTDLQRDSAGHAAARLSAPDGHTAELWADDAYCVIQVYTGDTLSPARRRTGLAVEPMTCPPNAFQSGEGLVRLEPGQSHVGRWGVRLI
ncbi:MAG TPA: aldose 1-epimerase family protein [Solirubrobacteraceae bacterium]|nr:aldose 1-epimerase family protein [Solirubrobacteraceae bacterium]